MKKIILLVALMVLAGCNPSYKTMSFPVMPDELKDCKIFELVSIERRIIVTRCPAAASTSTNFPSGKTTANSVVIDGVTYTSKETP